jgi:hypothetical protein
MSAFIIFALIAMEKFIAGQPANGNFGSRYE